MEPSKLRKIMINNHVILSLPSDGSFITQSIKDLSQKIKGASMIKQISNCVGPMF
jgi:hypothetical protein